MAEQGRNKKTLNITMHPERVRVDHVVDFSSMQNVPDGIKVLTFYSGIPLQDQGSGEITEFSVTVVANIALTKSIAKKLAVDLIKFLEECGEDVELR